MDSSGSTFESEFGRCIHDNKLDGKSMSLEVLGGYGVAMREGLQLQAWNSIVTGKQERDCPGCTPAVHFGLVY